MKVSLVVAVAENHVIGRDNGDIPWRIRTDLQHYKQLTLGHPIIMGRRTHESIGKPLPGRLNIVMTRDHDFRAAGCEVVHDAQAALAVAEASGADEAFVIGGGQIYDDLLPFVTTMYLTRVHAQPAGEAHFTFAENEWRVTSTEAHSADAAKDDEFAFTFMTLVRKT
jgi:dihydrofolate reductase